jgi:hypothetical protein
MTRDTHASYSRAFPADVERAPNDGAWELEPAGTGGRNDIEARRGR